MFTINSLSILLGILAALSASTSAFFLNWGSQEPPTTQPHYYYHQRLLQAPPTYTVAGTEPVPLPSIPVQVPLQAQLSPAATLQNVQLVPCLCPVSQDYEYDKTHQDGVFFNNNGQQHKNR